MMGTTGDRLMVLALVVWLAPAAAAATDQGEIALVEDDGSIAKVIMLPDQSLAAATKIFYKTHADNYDDLFVFWSSSGAGVQQGWTVNQPVKGIGRDVNWDQRTKFGVSATGRLNMTVKMGSLTGAGALPANPDDRAVIVPGYPLTGAELMGHEFGHHWLAAITYQQAGVTHCWVRGMEQNQSGGGAAWAGDSCDGYTTGDFNQHWSYDFNSRSVMYGGFYEDLGGGQFKLTYPAVGYSDLDQYLMGLRSLAEVDSSQLFIVNDGDPVTGSAAIPVQHGTEATVTGTKISFTMDDVIASIGARVPAADPCHRKAAFIIVHPLNQPPTAAQITTVDNYRKRWEAWWPWATGDRASVDTTLAGTGAGTASCPAPGAPDTCDAGAADCGGFPDTGVTTDAGYVACKAGITEGDLATRPCETEGDQCSARDSTCGTPAPIACNCMYGAWVCPAVDCIDGGAVTKDTGAPADAGDGGETVACGQYSSTGGYVGRPCAPDGQECQVDTTTCGSVSKVPCHCMSGLWTCPAIDCADSGTTQDTGTAADAGGQIDDTGTTGGTDTGGKAPGTDAGTGGESSGCSCATLKL